MPDEVRKPDYLENDALFYASKMKVITDLSTLAGYTAGAHHIIYPDSPVIDLETRPDYTPYWQDVASEVVLEAARIIALPVHEQIPAETKLGEFLKQKIAYIFLDNTPSEEMSEVLKSELLSEKIGQYAQHILDYMRQLKKDHQLRNRLNEI